MAKNGSMLLHDYYDNDNTKNSTRLDRRGPIFSSNMHGNDEAYWNLRRYVMSWVHSFSANIT